MVWLWLIILRRNSVFVRTDEHTVGLSGRTRTDYAVNSERKTAPGLSRALAGSCAAFRYCTRAEHSTYSFTMYVCHDRRAARLYIALPLLLLFWLTITHWHPPYYRFTIIMATRCVCIYKLVSIQVDATKAKHPRQLTELELYYFLVDLFDRNRVHDVQITEKQKSLYDLALIHGKIIFSNQGREIKYRQGLYKDFEHKCTDLQAVIKKIEDARFDQTIRRAANSLDNQVLAKLKSGNRRSLSELRTFFQSEEALGNFHIRVPTPASSIHNISSSRSGVSSSPSLPSSSSSQGNVSPPKKKPMNEKKWE